VVLVAAAEEEEEELTFPRMSDIPVRILSSLQNSTYAKRGWGGMGTLRSALDLLTPSLLGSGLGGGERSGEQRSDERSEPREWSR
jgi:hypothetical protein